MKHSFDAGLLILLEKNLAALERLIALLSRRETAPPAHPAHQAGLLTRDDVCAILGVTPYALTGRMRRGIFPRPVQGRGTKALWRREDVGKAWGPRTGNVNRRRR
jgi:hypothetical protein